MEKNVIYRKKVANFWFKVNELNDKSFLLSYRDLNRPTICYYKPIKILYTSNTLEIDKMIQDFLEN